MDDLLTAVEVAAHLQLARVTVQKWCKEGKLPAVKVGKAYRIRRSELEAWFEARRSAA